ncbi:MAG: SDR family oxidoreductase [Bacteroidota bacterium]
MDISLSGKHALVGGSTQGIGKAAAIELANLGARVTLLARNETSLKEVLAELPADQGHDYLVADFSTPEEVQSTVRSYLETHAPFHILVNNTGGPPGGQAIEADIAEFERAYRMHLICNHLLAQTLVPGMKEAGYGRIINVISTSVKIPITGLGVSNTTRGAVASWAKTLANELGQFGITVNNVLPGFTATERLFSLLAVWAKQQGISSDEMQSKMESSVPAKRIGDPSETANAIAFLASPAASYVNGINLPVDGGRTGAL